MKVKKLINHLQAHYSPEQTIATSIWSADDLKIVEGSELLNDEQINDVLENIDLNHDACIGINWNVIQEHICAYINNLEAEK